MEPDPPESAFTAEAGWRALNMPRKFGQGRSFVSGEAAGDRIRIHYFLREADEVLMAKVWFGLGAEGPPGHAHGGSMAAVLDEVMGFACWVAGHPVVAANISINFRRKLPLHQIFWAEGILRGTEGSKVHASGSIFDGRTGEVCTEGEGLFIRKPLEHFGALATPEI